MVIKFLAFLLTRDVAPFLKFEWAHFCWAYSCWAIFKVLKYFLPYSRHKNLGGQGPPGTLGDLIQRNFVLVST